MSEVCFGETVLDADTFSGWQKQIIYEQNRYPDPASEKAQQAKQEVTRRQRRLFDAIDNGPSALESYLLSESLKVKDFNQARKSVPELPQPLTENEMRRIPIHAERELYRALHDRLTPSQAAHSEIWALCHAVWIAQHKFGASLEQVFLEGPKAKTSEQRTRNFLRRIGGLRHVRGNISPLVDCPISMAWWRCRITDEVHAITEQEDITITKDAIHGTLWNKDVWTNLIGLSLKQMTSVCATKARAAAVVAFWDMESSLAKKGDTKPLIQGIVRGLGRLSYAHDLDTAPWGALMRAAHKSSAAH